MTIVEVAKAAGVSTATVSRVLNGLPGVRADTIAQVRATVSRLHYRPLRVRTPRKKSRKPVKLRTGNIAVITLGHNCDWLERPVLASVFGGIQRGTDAYDLRLMLGDMADVTRLSPLLLERQVDGAIVFVSSEIPFAQYESIFASMQKYVPIVWAMGVEAAARGVDHVTSDNVGIGTLAFMRLQQMRCQRYAFLTADPEWPLIRLRGQSFCNNALDAGFRPTVYIVTESEQVADAYGRRVETASDFAQIVDRLLAASPRPDGVFIPTDFTTSYFYQYLAARGVRPWANLQVVSCDNETARLNGMHPRPASIDVGAEEIGYRAVNRLINRIERPQGPALTIQVRPRLPGNAP